MSRAQLKARAKEVLKKWYWLSLGVTLVVSIISGGLGGFGFGGMNSIDINIPGGNDYEYNYDFGDVQFNEGGLENYDTIFGKLQDSIGSFGTGAAVAAILYVLLIVILLAIAFGFAYSIFVAFPFMVGKNRFFLETAKNDIGNFAYIAYSFKKGHYLKVAGSMAWMALFQFLWTLLFIIPGIIKAYAYSMTPYILAENPGIGYREALKLSMRLTKGHKWEIFVMQLSFIGWFLLGVLACGIGVVFVTPYYEATMAQLYLKLKGIALNKHDAAPHDFADAEPGPQI